MYTQFTASAHLKIRLVNTQVGPRHDPYGRDTVHIDKKDGSCRMVLTSCALAGQRFVVDGNCVAETQVFPSSEEKTQFNRAVTVATGYPPNYWLHDLWDQVYRHREPEPCGYYM